MNRRISGEPRLADYIYNLLDSKMKEDEDTKSRWLNKEK